LIATDSTRAKGDHIACQQPTLLVIASARSGRGNPERFTRTVSVKAPDCFVGFAFLQ
jgi:hypothetical protein